MKRVGRVEYGRGKLQKRINHPISVFSSSTIGGYDRILGKSTLPTSLGDVKIDMEPKSFCLKNNLLNYWHLYLRHPVYCINKSATSNILRLNESRNTIHRSDTQFFRRLTAIAYRKMTFLYAISHGECIVVYFVHNEPIRVEFVVRRC